MSFARSLKIVVFAISFSCVTAPPTAGRGRPNAVHEINKAVEEFKKKQNLLRGRARAGAYFEIRLPPRQLVKQKGSSATQKLAFCEVKDPHSTMDPNVFRHIVLVAKQFYRTFGKTTPIIVGDSKGAVGVLLAGLELVRGPGEPLRFFVLPSHESRHWTYSDDKNAKYASLPLQSHLFLSSSPGLRLKQVSSGAPIVEVDPEPEKEIVKRVRNEQAHLLHETSIIGLCMQPSDTQNLIKSAEKLRSQKGFPINGSRTVCITTRSNAGIAEIPNGIHRVYVSELLGILIENGHFRECYGRVFDIQTFTQLEKLSDINPVIFRNILVHSHTFATVPAFQNWVKLARTTLESLKKRKGRRVDQCESNLIKFTDSEHDELEYAICLAFLRDITGECGKIESVEYAESRIQSKREYYEKHVKIEVSNVEPTIEALTVEVVLPRRRGNGACRTSQRYPFQLSTRVWT